MSDGAIVFKVALRHKLLYFIIIILARGIVFNLIKKTSLGIKQYLTVWLYVNMVTNWI